MPNPIEPYMGLTVNNKGAQHKDKLIDRIKSPKTLTLRLFCFVVFDAHRERWFRTAIQFFSGFVRTKAS